MCVRFARFAVWLVLAGLSWAQSDRGTLTGRILDPTAGAIPGARITAVHQATQVKFASQSNEAGVYWLQQLPIGRYEVAVEAAGFRRYLRRDVEVNVAQTVTLNVSLEMGPVEQTIEVTAAASALQTSTSELGTVVSRDRVMDLPLSVSGNMRNPEQFIFLAPGVTGDTSNTQINGSQSRAKEVLLDGVGATSPESGGILFTYPSVEAIAEFKLVRNNFNAEYGRTGGGFEVFTTKSGGNRLHASVFDYLRNDAFDARGFFARQRAVNRQNEYGFSVGGPVLLPGYDGRNRSFFHAVFSGFRFRQGALAGLTSIPPVDFRGGDFSRLARRIYDPATTRPDSAGGFTRDPFPNNRIPQARFSAVSRHMVPLIPAPANDGLLNNFLTVGARRFDRDQINVKADHAFSDRSRLTGFLYVGTQEDIGAEQLPVPLSGALNDGRRSRWARLSHDWILSAAKLNNFTIGFTREGQFWAALMADQDWPDKVGLKGVNTGKGNAFPYVTFTDGYAGWANTNGGKTVGSQVNNVWQLNDSFSWVRGAHNFKFGGEARWMQTNGADFFNAQGRFGFNSLETALPTPAGRTTSGNGFASFLLGEVDNSLMQVLAVVPGNRYRYLAGYLQDDWKAGRKLTVNYGLRYEIYYPRSERFNNLSSFDPDLPNPAAGNRPGAIAFLGSGPGRNGRTSFADTEYGNFGPRLGVAYSLEQNTVVRTGYGIYFAPGNATAGLRSSQAFGFGFNATPSPTSTDSGVTPAFHWDQGFPQNFPKPPLIDPAVANGQNVNMIGRDDGRPPYFQNWTFSLQRELSSRLVVEVAYVGTKGTRLGNNLASLNQVDPSRLALGALLSRPVDSAEARAANIPLPYAGFRGSVAQALRPYPQYLTISQRSNPNGNSTYHAFQMQAERRLWHGLTWQCSYTWAKSISDADVQAGGGPAGQTFYNRRLEKAISTNDVPHVAALSYLYELPFGRGRRWLRRGLAGRLAGGWTFTGIHQYQAGRPITLSAQNTLPLFNGVLRPNVISGAARRNSIPDFDPARDLYINRAAFAVPPPLSFGTAARAYTDLRAFGLRNESFGLIKRTALAERLLLTFRAEFFNVFNRAVFAAPAANVSNANFGRVSAQSNAPRQGQLALKLEF